MKTILIQKTRLRWPWARHECCECPGAWYLRRPWVTTRHNPSAGPVNIIRWIQDMIIYRTERSVDLLKYIGGERG